MTKFLNYKVRVLLGAPYFKEEVFENLSYQDAVEKFKFYVSVCLEFSEFSVRCVNIIKGKKSIKLFQNHG